MATPVAGSVNALYGPTAFTATGLPSGLSINNDGQIVGRSSVVGEHNVTIGASNLAGTANTEVITVKVVANKPVFASTDNAFSPLDLSPGLWVDASDLTTITGSQSTISQWNDKSGNNRHLTQSTAASQPIYKWNALNELSVVRFDGTDDYFDGSGLGTPWIHHPVRGGQSSHGGCQRGTLASDGTYTSSKLHLYTSTSGLNSKMALHSGGTINGSNTKTLNSWSIDTFHRGDVTNWGSTGSIFHNGTLDASGTMGANTLLSLNAFNIGNWDDGSTKTRHLDGDLAELIIYPANLSDHERQQVEVYLARKWGCFRSRLVRCPVPRMHRRIHMFLRSVAHRLRPVYLWLMMVVRMQMLPFSTVQMT